MKLFVIVKKTLDAGFYTAQALHAFRAFVGEHPVIEADWHANHNNIVILQEEDLEALKGRLTVAGFKLSEWREPDRGHELTAICAEPASWRMLSSLPLAA